MTEILGERDAVGLCTASTGCGALQGVPCGDAQLSFCASAGPGEERAACTAHALPAAGRAASAKTAAAPARTPATKALQQSPAPRDPAARCGRGRACACRARGRAARVQACQDLG